MISLKHFSILELIRWDSLKSAHDARENVLDGSIVHAPYARNVPVTWLDSQFDVGQPGPILAAVVLLFHQQVHFVEAIECRAVLIDVVLQWLFKSKQRYAAFVLEEVAHGVPEVAKVSGQIYTAHPTLTP